MENVENFNLLPDSLDLKELNEYFLHFLKEADTNKYNQVILYSALCELADRQWHCYEIMSDKTKSKIESWINNNFNLDDINIVESIIFVIGHIGLQNTYLNLKKNDLNLIPKNCKNAIFEAFEEFGENVSDPYDRLKNEVNNKSKKYEITKPKKEKDH